jgi:hypothetical protein
MHPCVYIAGLTLMDSGLLVGALSFHKRPHGGHERGTGRRGRTRHGARDLIVAQTAPPVQLGEYMVTTVLNGYTISAVIDTVRSEDKHWFYFRNDLKCLDHT